MHGCFGRAGGVHVEMSCMPPCTSREACFELTDEGQSCDSLCGLVDLATTQLASRRAVSHALERHYNTYSRMQDNVGPSCDGIYMLMEASRRWRCFGAARSWTAAPGFRAACACIAPSPPPPSPPPPFAPPPSPPPSPPPPSPPSPPLPSPPPLLPPPSPPPSPLPPSPPLPPPPSPPPSLPPPSPMIPCGGSYVHGDCWLLTATGETCAQMCGSAAEVQADLTVRGAYTSIVVHELTAAYGLDAYAADDLGVPCGVADSSFPYAALYLYTPAIREWGCFRGETFAEFTGPYYRSPCLCQTLPPAQPSRGMLKGAGTGVAILVVGVLLLGRFWGACSSPASEGAWAWKLSMATGAVLQLLDQASDLLVIAHFAYLEQWGYFYVAVCFVVLPAILGLLFGILVSKDDKTWLERIITAVLGLFGLLGPLSALRGLCSGEGSDGDAFGFFTLLKVMEALFESSPQFLLQSIVITLSGWRHIWVEQPIVVISALLSLGSISHTFTSAACSDFSYFGPLAFFLDSIRVREPKHRKSKVVMLGLLVHCSANLLLRTMAACVLAYAAGGSWGLLTPIWWLCLLWCGGLACAVDTFAVPNWSNLVGDDLEPRTGLILFESFDTALCTLMTLTGLSSGMPRPHVDPDFIENTYAALVGGIISKLVTHFWMRPAFSPHPGDREVWGTCKPQRRLTMEGPQWPSAGCCGCLLSLPGACFDMLSCVGDMTELL